MTHTQLQIESFPLELSDPVNAAILAVSEDRIQGFHRDPLGEIARLSGIPVLQVTQRIAALLRAGVIRRVRQTLLATNLASGALVAWEIPPGCLSAGFDYLFQRDPFSGHVVIRSTDGETTGSKYRLWTTLKVPQGFSLDKHCAYLMKQIGALSFKIMPARRLFALGVGHVRRKGMEPGSKSEELADVLETRSVELTDLQWQVLTALKREFSPDELTVNLWDRRAQEAGVSLEEFTRWRINCTRWA